MLSKILDLSDTQAGILAVVFKYCVDNNLPLLDLADLKKSLNFVIGDGQDEVEEEYGKMSSTSVGTIIRKIVALEQQARESYPY